MRIFCNKIIIVFLIIVGVQNLSIGNSTDTLKLLEAKVDSLELKISALNDSIANFGENYKTINEAVKLSQDFIEKPIATSLKYGAYSTAIILLLVGLFFWILKIVNPKWFMRLIQRWVETAEEVNVLKSEKSILVISSDNFPNEIFIKKLFSKRKFNFQKVTFVAIGKLNEALEKQDFDLIFANNEDGKLSQADLEKVFEKKKYSAAFYYGKSGSWNFKNYKTHPEFLQRINFANSRSQIYGNLLSSLKFHDTLI